VERQDAAWNRGDLTTYFKTFTANARFIAQARTPSGQLVPYGASTVTQARAQARRFMAKSRGVDRTIIASIQISADARRATVLGRKLSLVTSAGRTRRICSEVAQIIDLEHGRPMSGGQTETLVACDVRTDRASNARP
jgi:hypothetical protein